MSTPNVDVTFPDVTDVTQLKAREQSRRARRSRDSSESIGELAQRLSVEAQVSEEKQSFAPAAATSLAASVMDAVNGAVHGVVEGLSQMTHRSSRQSRESRNSKEGSATSGSAAGSRRASREGRASKEGKRRKSGEFIDEPTITMDNLSGQRMSLFMQELQAELCDHCRKGNTDMVRAILDKDEELVPQVVELLGDRNVELDAATAVGETPLIKACDSGKIDLVKMLIERGASVTKCGKDGVTPLHSSAGFGRVELAKASSQRLEFRHAWIFGVPWMRYLSTLPWHLIASHRFSPLPCTTRSLSLPSHLPLSSHSRTPLDSSAASHSCC